jgi:cell division cycle protein 20 (cofactor of APC complex)
LIVKILMPKNVPFFKSSLYSKQSEDEYITCVSWVSEGNYLAVGDSTGSVDLWDVQSSKLMRSMRGHADRISTLGWNAHVLASGSRRGDLFLHDVRIADHHVATLEGHSQEVCGMAWSPESNCHTLATGANDNIVLIWDDRNTAAPIFTFNDHQAAIKAVAFCPWQPRTLATGGGSLDRTIRFWNTSTGNMLNSIDTGSQVSAIVWGNEEYKELASAHGYSHNQVTVWKYPNMAKVADLQAHTSRVLTLLKSPDGTTVASAAGDETIRMWKLWPLNDKKAAKGDKAIKANKPVSLFNKHSIR